MRVTSSTTPTTCCDSPFFFQRHPPATSTDLQMCALPNAGEVNAHAAPSSSRGGAQHSERLVKQTTTPPCLHAGEKDTLPSSQHQHILSSLAWRKLSVWQRLPGCTAVLEMLVRGQSLSSSCTIVTNSIHVALVSMTEQCRHSTPFASHCGNASLITSIHKSMLLHATPLAGGGGSPLLASGSAAPGKCLTLKQVKATHASLRTLLTAVLAHAQATQSASAHHSTASVDVEKAHAAVTAQASSAVCFTHESSSSSNGITTPGSMRTENSSKQLAVDGTRRFTAVLVMVMVWLSNLRSVMQAQGNEVEQPSERGSDWVGVLEGHHPELGKVARALVVPPTHSKCGEGTSGFEREAVAWDAYALRHCHGRFLPGCGYLGCTNVKGASEESLDTLLCSGCRRVRYCSVGCQKAAWGKGMHAHACGKEM